MFSVIIPLWNKGESISSALQSVADQTYADFEVIVVDDGSTDDGPRQVEAVASTNARLVRQPNMGGGAARNTGATLAKHRWLAFLDADDLWLPGHLAELDRIRGLFPAAGLIGTAYWISQSRVPRPVNDVAGAIEEIDYFSSIGSGEDPLWVSSAAIPKDVWTQMGGFAPRSISTDSEMWAKIALQHSVAVSRRRTAIYVTGSGGVIDGARRRFIGNPPQTLADLSATPALVANELEASTCPEKRRSLERFIDRYVGWFVMSSAGVGDIESIRALKHLYRGKPAPLQRLLIVIASLPPPLARTAYRAGLGLKAFGRRLGGALR